MGNDDGLQFGHFRAMIRIGGKPAQCYAVDVNKRKKEVTCWIASEVGQKFAVSLKKEETPYNCSPAIFLDDKKIVYRPLEKSFVGRRLYGSVVTSKTTRRPFVFGELSVTDNDTYLDGLLLKNPMNGNIGEIKIKIHRGVHIVREKIRNDSWNSEESDEADSDSGLDDESESGNSEEDETNSVKRASKTHAEDIPSIRMVHESSSKATNIPHQIKFGENFTRPRCAAPKEAPPRSLGRPNVLERLRAEASNISETPKRPTAVSFQKIKECLVTFVFKYRPIEILQAHGVAPRPPPVPLPVGPVTVVPENALPEVHKSPSPIFLLGMINEEENNQLPSNANSLPSSHIVADNALHSTPELATSDENMALATLTGSSTLYPPMRLSTPEEEEKPTITTVKTAEEDDIDSKISLVLLHLDKIRSKKRQIEEAQDTIIKRVKIENLRHFLPGETIDLSLDSDV